MAGKASSSLGGFAFEVHGRVQRVFFRNHTVDEAVRLGLVGWVANTARGTVTGEAQGPVGQLEHFKVGVFLCVFFVALCVSFLDAADDDA